MPDQSKAEELPNLYGFCIINIRHVYIIIQADHPGVKDQKSGIFREINLILFFCVTDEDTAHKLRTQRETSSGEPVIDKVRQSKELVDRHQMKVVIVIEILIFHE